MRQKRFGKNRPGDVGCTNILCTFMSRFMMKDAVDYHPLTSYSPLISALLSLVIAQVLKIFTTYLSEKRWDISRIAGSGGMPSSHSATVMGVTAAIGFRYGPGDSVFAVSLVLALIVMYDAMGVRLQAGKQAEVLNQIVYELPPEHPVNDPRRGPLKDTLGHTPVQVLAGAILGCVVAWLCYLGSPDVRERSLHGEEITG